MANEAVLIFETELPIPFTCDNATGIEKGTLLKMADPATVSAAIVYGDFCGGIAATEKIVSDGRTKIGVYRGGIFKVFASGSITAGDVLTKSFSTTNLVEVAVAADVSSKTWGIALETATVGESFLMELRPGANNKAYS